MDKDFVKQYNLQEAVKRFNQINEYTFWESPLLNEEGEDEEQQNDAPQDQMGGEQPPVGGEEPPMPQGNTDMQQDMGNPQSPNDMQQPPMDNQQPPLPQGDSEIPPMGEPNTDDNVEQDGEGDTVIDVDDLTQSQEATEIKIDGVDDRLTKVLTLMNKFTDALDVSNKKIDDLRQEFEKRNPSEEEKLNLRSQASYPYSETPKGYWDEKMANDPRYNVIYDNDVSTADELKKFDITQDDIDNINVKDVSDSFDMDDLKLEDFLKL